MTAALTVTELTQQIEETLEHKFMNCEVEGEITELKNFNGNRYFSLKDERSKIGCVLWRSVYDRMFNLPKVAPKHDTEGADLSGSSLFQEGSKIKARGQIKVYAKTGKYQLYVSKMEFSGIGELFQEYTRLKDKLEKLGYFSKDRKKVLPKKINAIGIVTSYDGAVIHDILSVLKKNGYCGEVAVKKCNVQGDNCPQSVADGINYFNNEAKVDVIIIARGGGSFEDLFGYSNKKVLKAIYKSKICTISAVGHETDNMLSDYVADIRVPTPSVAGALIANTYSEYQRSKLDTDEFVELKDMIQQRITELQVNIGVLGDTLIHPYEKSRHVKSVLDEELIELSKLIDGRFDICQRELEKQQNIIATYDPTKILKSGYVQVKHKNKSVNTRAEVLKQKLKYLMIHFSDGPVKVKVINV